MADTPRTRASRARGVAPDGSRARYPHTWHDTRDAGGGRVLRLVPLLRALPLLCQGFPGHVPASRHRHRRCRDTGRTRDQGSEASLHVAPALTSPAVVGRHACQHRKIARLRQQFARLERFASCPAHACAHGEERDRVGALWLDYVRAPLGTRERPGSAQRICGGLAGLPAPPHRFVGRGHRDVAGLITERAVTAGEPAGAGRRRGRL